MDQNYNNSPKYTYDYPENREIGENLTDEDRKWIADILGKTTAYVYRIFVTGDRTNQRAIDLANILIRQKQEREKLAQAV